MLMKTSEYVSTLKVLQSIILLLTLIKIASYLAITGKRSIFLSMHGKSHDNSSIDWCTYLWCIQRTLEAELLTISEITPGKPVYSNKSQTM